MTPNRSVGRVEELAALEALLDDSNRLPVATLNDRTEAWRHAYLRTPHGQPVKLEN